MGKSQRRICMCIYVFDNLTIYIYINICIQIHYFYKHKYSFPVYANLTRAREREKKITQIAKEMTSRHKDGNPIVGAYKTGYCAACPQSTPKRRKRSNITRDDITTQFETFSGTYSLFPLLSDADLNNYVFEHIMKNEEQFHNGLINKLFEYCTKKYWITDIIENASPWNYYLEKKTKSNLKVLLYSNLQILKIENLLGLKIYIEITYRDVTTKSQFEQKKI